MRCEYFKIYYWLEHPTGKIITFPAKIISFTHHTFISFTRGKLMYLPFMLSTPMTFIEFNSQASLTMNAARRMPFF